MVVVSKHCFRVFLALSLLDAALCWGESSAPRRSIYCGNYVESDCTPASQGGCSNDVAVKCPADHENECCAVPKKIPGHLCREKKVKNYIGGYGPPTCTFPWQRSSMCSICQGGGGWGSKSCSTRKWSLECSKDVQCPEVRDGHCLTCATGFYSDAYGSCKQCPAGFECKNGTKLLCPTGTYSSGGTTTDCLPCANGTISTRADRTKCQVCPPGKFAVAGAQSCKMCPAGSECIGGKEIKCTPGYFSATTGAIACGQCRSGTFADSFGRTKCDDCSEMTFADYPGATVCAKCRPCVDGQFRDGCGGPSPGECTACTASCPNGLFLIGNCSGAWSTADRTCVSCGACPGHQFRKRCIGSNPGRCENCTHTLNNCGEGSYLANSCKDSTITDNSACNLCIADCAKDEYLHGCGGTSAGYCKKCRVNCESSTQQLIGQCDGTTKRDATCIDQRCSVGEYEDPLSGECTLCDTQSCDEGEYIAYACDGKGTEDRALCVKCGDCLYANQFRDGCRGASPGTCKSCNGLCQDGEHISVKCDDDGSFFAPACVSCKQCKFGELLDGCDPNDTDGGQCITCELGRYAVYYDEKTRRGYCEKCSACNVGEIRSGCAGADAGHCVRCKPSNSINGKCPPNFYIKNACDGSSVTDISRCASCTSNIPCKYGEYLHGCEGDNRGVCLPTTECMPGIYIESSPPTLLSDRSCKPCARCYSGEYVVGACTPYSDTQCGPLTTCKIGETFMATEYIEGTASEVGSDRICESVTPCELFDEKQGKYGTQFLARRPTRFRDYECDTLSVPSAAQYIKREVNRTLCDSEWNASNSRPDSWDTWPCVRDIADRTMCGAQFYISRVGSIYEDNECSRLTTCEPYGELYTLFEPTESSNRICANCTDFDPGLGVPKETGKSYADVCGEPLCGLGSYFSYVNLTLPQLSKCARATECIVGVSFMVSEYDPGSWTTLGSDRVCKNTTPCNLTTEYLVTQATKFTDNVCAPQPTLDADQLSVMYAKRPPNTTACADLWSGFESNAPTNLPMLRPRAYNQWPCTTEFSQRTACPYPYYASSLGSYYEDANCTLCSKFLPLPPERDETFDDVCRNMTEADPGVCEKAANQIGTSCIGLGSIIGGLVFLFLSSSAILFVKRKHDWKRKQIEMEATIDDINNKLEIQMNVNPLTPAQSSQDVIFEREKFRLERQAHAQARVKDIEEIESMKSELRQMKKVAQQNEFKYAPNFPAASDSRTKVRKKEFAPGGVP